MIQQIFTEGAYRAIQLAERIATAGESTEVETRHLLCALLMEESRASEILTANSLTLDFVRESCQLEFSAEVRSTDSQPTSVEEPDTDTQATGCLVPESDAFRRVCIEARRQAGLLGRHVETGSEHLVLGLVSIESPVSEMLRQHGLDQKSLSEHVAEQTGFSSEPLEMDVSIQWKDRTPSDLTDTYRILDAAGNRAREGLRVIEDFVRFTLDDAQLTQQLKIVRHELSERWKSCQPADLLAARDTETDVGTQLTTRTEWERASLVDVVRASCKRVQEAMRSLEEFAKVVSSSDDRTTPGVQVDDGFPAQRLEQIRYRLYTLEKAILMTHANRDRFLGRNLYLLLSESLCHHGSGPAVRDALRAGVSIVQLREKAMPDRQLVEYGKRVREWTREADAFFIMNDRPDLAVLTDADGVHVGQDELTVREARRIVGPDRLVGVSTHTIEQARQAALNGADYIGVGPVFASTTKQFDDLAGLEFVRAVAAEVTLPWFAIGGINSGNIDDVRKAGATRVAVSGAVCGAEHPGQAVLTLAEKLRG